MKIEHTLVTKGRRAAPAVTLAALTTAAGLIGDTSPVIQRPQAACAVEDASDETSYDQAYQRACHNCYEPQYAPALSAVLDTVTSIEIDFWDDENLFVQGGSPGAWFVRHLPLGGNHSNASGKGDLAAALTDVRRWSDEHPGHDVITIYLDKKQPWSPDRRPVDLDRLIFSIFPRSQVFTPELMRGEHPTLRRAAAAGAWPSLGELRGKVVFVLTGGELTRLSDLFVPNRTQHAYVAARGAAAAAFVAPDTHAHEDIDRAPRGFDESTARWVVFHNVHRDAADLGPAIRKHRRMARVWGLDETDEEYRDAVGRCANFIAIYDFANPGLMKGRSFGMLLPFIGPHRHRPAQLAATSVREVEPDRAAILPVQGLCPRCAH